MTELEELNQMGQRDFVVFVVRCLSILPGSRSGRGRIGLSSRLNRSISRCATPCSKRSHDEQVALIASHPDLVGRMAREGRLTRESTAEQRAAGLNDLTQERNRTIRPLQRRVSREFGFPFVICAARTKRPRSLRRSRFD